MDGGMLQRGHTVIQHAAQEKISLARLKRIQIRIPLISILALDICQISF